MKLFRKGYFQVLPFRDHCGRRVLTLLGGFEPGVDAKMRAKALFYISDVLTRDDIESQQKGLAVIGESYMWSAGDGGSGSRDKRSNSLLKFPHPKEGLHYIKQLTEAMPNRLIALHNCWPDRPAFRLISKLLAIYGVSGSTQRLRLKFHIGDELEMRYRLKSYGIPIEMLPITETGSTKMINHNHWIKTRKHIEQGIDDKIKIVKCRDLVLSLLEDRDNALKDNNNSNFSNGSSWNNNNNAARIHNEIVDQLVNQIECQRHGRFLEWDKHRGAWIQIDGLPKVKQKVSVLVHSIGKRYRKTVAPTTTSSNSNSNSNSNSI